MKPQQLAKLLNISPVTLRHWCSSEYGEFLSPTAQGSNGAKRSFTDLDARILSWVAAMKEQNMNTSSILITLRNSKSQNWKDLPALADSALLSEPVEMIPREAVEERIRALQDKFETRLATLNERITTLERENGKLLTENAELRAELINLTRESMKISSKLASLLTRKK